MINQFKNLTGIVLGNKYFFYIKKKTWKRFLAKFSFSNFSKMQFLDFLEQKSQQVFFKFFYQTGTFLLSIIFYVLKTLF